jgi:alkylation response protein AidB-like acyl-CoA dehydrogenase
MVGEDRVIVALVPAGSKGITVTPGWDTFGMRTSDTGRLDLADVEVDERLVFYQAPADEIDALVVAGVIWFTVLLGGTYHGAMSRLLLTVAESIDCRPIERQMAMGDGLGALLAFGAACQGLAHAWVTGHLDTAPALASALAVRRALSATRDSVVHTASIVAGGRVYGASHELGHLLADLAAADHHPPGLLTTQLALGRLATGYPATLAPHASLGGQSCRR